MTSAAPANGVLITGANGFVGSALRERLVALGANVRAAVRQPSYGHGDVVVMGNIDAHTDWHSALQGIDCVVHLAARAHIMDDKALDPVSEFRRINVLATEKLALDAVACGVRRLVFLSSVKVNGETTTKVPYSETDRPQPEDAYGQSKWEAEQVIWRVAAAHNLDVVVLRPPLIYGPGVKGNFLRLMRLTTGALPLPLASIKNLRSLIFVENLVDAIIACIEARATIGTTYLVSDGQDISTPDLVRALSAALGIQAKLFHCPVALLKVGGAIIGQNDNLVRLTGSLRIDCTKIDRELGWRARYSLEEGLRQTARWYHAQSARRSAK